MNPSFGVLVQSDHELEYTVGIGDYQTYIYTKFYDSRLIDPYREQNQVNYSNGSFANYTIENGTKIRITITNITGNDFILGNRTIDDRVTVEEDWIDLFVRPMTNNQSSLAESFSESDSFEFRNNLIFEEVTESPFISESILYNLNRTRTSIWERTGWINSFSIHVYDASTVYYEMEVIKQSPQIEHSKSNETIGIVMLGFILLMLLYLQFVAKRSHK